MSANPAIVARGVTKDFPSGENDVVQVLHGVDLTTYNGELSLLVGPSGCGKTTLISIITAILSTTSGEVQVNGRDITHLGAREKVLFRRREVGFIFQQYNLLPALTAAENAAVTLVADGMRLSEATQKARDTLAFLGMEAHAEKRPAQLSGGMQQRVAIARALVHEPQLIVCDEPTSALDAHTGQAVMELLQQVAHDPGRSVLAVTHDPRIFHFADRLFTMGDGVIEKEETLHSEGKPHEH